MIQKKTVRGALVILLVVSLVWNFTLLLPLKKASHENRQAQRFITAVDGTPLEQPITVEAFVKQIHKANREPTRENDKRLTVASPNERKSKQVSILTSIETEGSPNPGEMYFMNVSIVTPDDGAILAGSTTVEILVTMCDGDGNLAPETVDDLWLYRESELIRHWTDVGGRVEDSWDTSFYSDGLHTLKAVGKDSLTGSNTYNDSISVTIDNTAPSITITSPADEAHLNYKHVMVTWNGSDTLSGIDYYEVRNDSTSWTDKGTSTNHTFENMPERKHTVDLRAFDQMGNINSTSVTFTVDTTPPSITITSPADGSYLNQTDVTVSWSGSDPLSGIAYYEVKNDSGSWTDVGTSTSHTFNGMPEGEHTVSVRAYDKADNPGSDDIGFTVDVTPPSVEITRPSDGVNVSASSVTVAWSGSDGTSGIQTYRYKVDTSDWTNTSDTSHPFTGLSEGSHTVQVKAYDWAGNTNTKDVTFTVDTTDPIVTIDYPTNGTFFNSTSVTVNWTVSDDITNIEYRYKLDDNQYVSWMEAGATSSSGAHTFSSLSEGLHRVYVQGRDQALNTVAEHVTFTIDTDPPTISEFFIDNKVYEDEYAIYVSSKNITVYVSASDEYHLTEVTVSVSGSTSRVALNTTDKLDWSETYCFTVPNGVYHIALAVTDRAGNKITADISKDVVVDTERPSVSFVSLGVQVNDGRWAIESGEYPFTFSLSDNIDYTNWGAKYTVTIYLGGSNVTKAEHLLINANASYAIPINAERIPQGNHSLSMSITDPSANTKITNFDVTITVDASPPTISFNSPRNQTVHGSYPLLTFTASDSCLPLDSITLNLTRYYNTSKGVVTSDRDITLAPSGRSYEYSNKPWYGDGDYLVFVFAFDPSDTPVTSS